MPPWLLPVADRFIDRIWWDRGFLPGLARTLLRPIGRAYLGAARIRNQLFDGGRLKVSRTRIPVASIGNLTAGGTGKTPVSAWVANALRERGASPAIVMRGYGSDEALVHGVLTPGTPVITSKSRADGVNRADAELGCDVAVLDDAFQHRWIHRVIDIVLLGAEETLHPRYGLPAGPWRESLGSLNRASLVIVTRKTAGDAQIETVLTLIRKAAFEVPTAVVSLVPGDLVKPGSTGSEERLPITAVAGENVLAIAGIGNARSFVEQVARFAGTVQHALYPDHHPFSASDVRALVNKAGRVDRVVCTLKDLVKLSPLWPGGAPPLWYVSQQVIIERGADEINKQLAVLLSARLTDNEPAGRRRPPPDINGN